jgi:phenylacetate-CoA ligase
MADLYDSLESRDPAAREQALLSALPALLTRAMQAPGWANILSGVTAGDINSRAALAQLPVTRKSALKDLQQAV